MPGRVLKLPLLLLPLSLLLMSCLTSGCGKQEQRAQNGVIVLDFWNGFTGPDGKTMEKIVDAFNKEHKNVKVRMQIIPWGTYYDKVTLGLAYGKAPDVFILHTDRLPEYADSEALNCIDDLVRLGGLQPKDFMPRAWSAARWKGHQYAIPLDCHPIGLYYNVDLFKKAGIVDDKGKAKPPRNLTEFVEAAKKLTVDRNKDGRPEQWGFAFTWLRTNAHTFLAQYGTGWISRDLKHSDLTSPNARKAFSLMTRFIYQDKICPAPEGQDAWVGFRTGKVAMALEGIYMLTSVEEQAGLHFAGAPCPQFGPVPAVWGGSHLMAMPAKISPERRSAAWTFIKYLSDHSLEWARGGQVPVRKSILASAEFRRLKVQYEFSKKLPRVVYLPQSVATNQVLPFCDACVEAILNRIKPMDEALSEAARRINHVLERS